MGLFQAKKTKPVKIGDNKVTNKMALILNSRKRKKRNGS